MSYFKTGTPESQGISSEGIIDFLEAVKAKGVELHRLMLIRHGICVAKACADPYKEDQLHPLYSFSKSFTSTAIGFAIQEGLMTLDDKLVDFFPDKLPAKLSENLKKCRIRHLLTMSCGHETEIDYSGEDWIERFLAHPFVYEPGTFYLYNSAGTNMLSAVIQKVTGQDLLSYLKPRLFDPLGFGEVYCARLADEYQTYMGGGGMKLQLEDMAKFTQFMLQNGEWEGKKLLNDWYEQMGSKQIETAGDSFGHIKDWAQGYGFQCWMCMPEKSFRADGAFGQFGLVFPTMDFIVVTNMATEMTQTFMDLVNEILLPAVKDASLPENPSMQHRLSSRLKNLHIMPLSGCRHPSMEKWMDEKGFSVMKSDADTYVNSFDTLIGGAGLFDLDDETEIRSMQFSFSDKDVIWTVLDGESEKVLHASLEGKFIYSNIGDRTYASTARWRSRTALEMEVRRMDSMSGCRMIFRICETDVTLRMEAEDTLITDGDLGMTEKAMLVLAAK